MSAPQPKRELCEHAANACACFNFRKASRAVTKLFDESLQPLGLRSTQFVTLLNIYLHEPVTIAALSRELVSDRTTLVRNVGLLEREGYVSSTQRDKRVRLYKLTPKGRKALFDGIPMWERAQTTFVEKMGAAKWGAVLDGLKDAVSAAKTA